MPTLFDPLKLGDLEVPNRIFMAPLTRNRSSGAGRVPNALMRDYYVQRASAGLIFTEATSVSPQGVGYPHTPGIWSHEQVDGWRAITKAVHAAGGRIFSSALARRAHIRSRLPRRRASRCAERDRAQGPCEPHPPAAPLRRPARARDARAPGRRRGLPEGRRERQGRRLRRRRDPRRQRLPLGSVPAGRQQQADRPIRRRNREPRPAHARSDRRRRFRVGRGPGRHAHRAARRRSRHGRQRLVRDLRLCRARAR